MTRPPTEVVLALLALLAVGTLSAPAAGSVQAVPTAGSGAPTTADHGTATPNATANVSVTVEVMPGTRPLPASAADLARLRASGNLTRTTRASTVDTAVFTLRAPNLTGRLARYEGSPAASLRSFLDGTRAAFRVVQSNPGTEREEKEMYVLSDAALERNATRVSVGERADAVVVAVDIDRVPLWPEGDFGERGPRRLYDGDAFAVGFTLEDGVVGSVGPADQPGEFEPVGALYGDNPDNLTRAQVRRLVVQEADVDPIPTALDAADEPAVRYVQGPAEAVPMETTLAPGSRVTVTAGYGADAPPDADGGVRRTVSVGGPIGTAYPGGSRVLDPRYRVDGSLYLLDLTWGLPDAPAPYEVTFSFTRDGTVVENETATVAPARATLDVPRQRRDGDAVFVRNVSLSHGGLLALTDDSGEEVLATRTLRAGVHGRTLITVPDGVTVPREPRVVAYRDVDLDGAVSPRDLPYRTDGAVVADSGEYVTPTPTPTPTAAPTETPEPTATPPQTAGPVPGFGAGSALFALALATLHLARRSRR